jgi:hypothetical protein
MTDPEPEISYLHCRLLRTPFSSFIRPSLKIVVVGQPVKNKGGSAVPRANVTDSFFFSAVAVSKSRYKKAKRGQKRLRGTKKGQKMEVNAESPAPEGLSWGGG